MTLHATHWVNLVSLWFRYTSQVLCVCPSELIDSAYLCQLEAQNTKTFSAVLRKDFTYVAGKTDRPWEHFTGRWEAGKFHFAAFEAHKVDEKYLLCADFPKVKWLNPWQKSFEVPGDQTNPGRNADRMQQNKARETPYHKNIHIFLDSSNISFFLIFLSPFILFILLCHPFGVQLWDFDLLDFDAQAASDRWPRFLQWILRTESRLQATGLRQERA